LNKCTSEAKAHFTTIAIRRYIVDSKSELLTLEWYISIIVMMVVISMLML